MSVLQIIGGVLILITSLILIFVVILQDSKQTGLSGSISGSENFDSYYGKNKGRTADAMLARITKISAIVFVGLTLAVNIIAVYVK